MCMCAYTHTGLASECSSSGCILKIITIFSSDRKAINGHVTRLWIFSSDFHGLLEEAELFHLCVENKYVCFFSLMHADIQPFVVCTHVCVADPCQSFSENAAYNACRMTILYSDLHWLLIASTGTGFSRKSMSVISRCGPDAVMLQWCCSDAGLAWVTAASIQYRYFPGIEKGAFALVYLCLVAPGLCLTLFRASS